MKMKKYTLVLLFGLFLIFSACEDEKEVSSLDSVNWGKKKVTKVLSDSLFNGSTYLSVYSEIYSLSEHLTHNLTATISIRNTSRTDSLFIIKAEYFNTHGKHIRTYIDKPIFLLPLETIAIVIDEKDKEGGTGANFLFDWKMNKNTSEPLFEGVMISTSGQQGLSFTTQGKKID
jgi:hypothetical protein